uniref:Peptidase S74 domain-containing protein n=1 Tax=viral metagenome TaxID=1070528 RepID=A0A6C0H6Q9_9ZZZZ
MATSINYNGRQPNNTSYIKNFVQSSLAGGGGSFFKYAYLFGEKVLTTIMDIDIYFPGNLFIGGSFYNNYGTYFTGSDQNIKNNIIPISLSDSNKIYQLKPVQFQYNSEQNKHTHFGLIAQDIQPIYPNLVHKNKDNTLFVNYQEIIPLLIHELQQLKKENQQLQNYIRNLHYP